MLANLNQIKRATTNITCFRGINRSCNTGFSRFSNSNSSIYTEFSDMQNMSADNYPQMSPRKCRSRLLTLNNSKIISNILSSDGGLIYIDSTGNLFCKGRALDDKLETDTTEEKQLVQFGNNVIIFPDKKFVNLRTGELTSMEQVNEDVQMTSAETNEVYTWAFDCSIDKVALNASVKPKKKITTLENYRDFSSASLQNIETDAQANKWIFDLISVGDVVEDACSSPSVLWMCTSSKDDNAYYNEKLLTFTEITSYYVCIRANGIGTDFKKGDFVKIYGMEHNTGELEWYGDDTDYIDVLNNNYFKLYDVAENYIVIKANINSSVPYCGTISVSRTVPDLDTGLIMEVDNRLWGCNSSTNEVYACKQGDATNWHAYSDAIATDSYYAQIGCEGDFTAVARQNSSIIFFKENWVLKLYGNKPSNFTLNKYNVSGVEKGSRNSVVWLNGILFYKAREGIMEYSPGGQPQLISEYAFGSTVYKNAVGGRHRSKYYVSLENSGTNEMFCYDIEKGIWDKEDSTKMRSTTTYNDILYYVDDNTGYIMCPEDGNNLLERTAVSGSESGHTGELLTFNGNEYIYGDLNGDGLVTNEDVQILQDYLQGEEELTNVQLAAADVNADGYVTIEDVTAMKRCIKAQGLQKEKEFEWYCQTGDMYDNDFNTKFISRLQIGLKPEHGTEIRICARFEDGGELVELAHLRYREKLAVSVPIAVRRSEFLQIRIEGKGYCEIYGISVTYSRGSEIKHG